MKLLQRLVFLSLGALFIASGAKTGAVEQFSAASRTFTFTYEVTLKDLPASAHRARVWIPRAVSDSHQTVTLKKITGPVRLRETQETPFENHILYGEILDPPASPTVITVEYEITRKEFSQGDFAALEKPHPAGADHPRNMDRFLKADQLVPIDGRIKIIADEQTRGKVGTVEKAHALYNYVFQTVRYDKSGTGWGRGDSLWVCDSRHGNCTDFHSLFISLARAEGIPARFEIGFPIAPGAEGTIPGYHCWAEFYVGGIGWVPVDISEAWKDPRKRDYFFGSIDSNRVQFSLGRDLTLNPRQGGGPLNYFVYPYVEVDGKPFPGVGREFSYKEGPAKTQVAWVVR